MVAPGWREVAHRSADPAAVDAALSRMVAARPDLADRFGDDSRLAEAVVVCLGASRALTRLLESDPGAVDVLARLGPDPVAPGDVSGSGDLVRWKQRELLRIAARDLLGEDPLETTVAAISACATAVLEHARRLAGAERLAVVAMGKLGGRELNYASDVDVVFVGDDGGREATRAARRLLVIARRCWPIDTALRPEGRDGALVRTVDSYAEHWDRWADPWEYQALLKARPVAGDATLGSAFAAAAAERLWNRPFSAEDLRSLRALKERAEADAARRSTGERQLKLGPGGIRDVEFSLQLLQLVHGRHDERLRDPGTLPALDALTLGGYIDGDDAGWLRWGYRFQRRVEHVLQLDDDRADSSVPADPARRSRTARILGFRDGPRSDALRDFDRELTACRSVVREIHRRLYFRPLLEAFGGVERPLSPDAAAARLAAFGFADADRTRQAVAELTHGLTRSSTLMQQLLPLLLDWLSTTPDPDAGLLGLRRLADGPTRSMELAAAFRESSVTARRLCLLLGTSPRLSDLLARNPDLIEQLGSTGGLVVRSAEELAASARAALDLRDGPDARQKALHRFSDREGLRIAAHDVLGLADAGLVGRALSALAQATVTTALDQAAPTVPLTLVAVGRFGGSELSYASDLDLVVIHGGTGDGAQAEAERATRHFLHVLRGSTPATLIYDVDLDLRPEGRNGPLVRSVDSHVAYFERWAQMWERQAFVRARPVAGDRALADELLDRLDPLVWRPVSDDDRRAVRRMKARIEAERLPVGEDPEFHLKLGPGAMADVEFCTQLLQLEHGVRGTGTIEAIEALRAGGVLDADDAAVLAKAYRFCEATRNRWFLVRGTKSDSLPAGPALATLARSLATTAPDLRDHYRRVTRRARRVVVRRFYGTSEP